MMYILCVYSAKSHSHTPEDTKVRSAPHPYSPFTVFQALLI